MGYFFYFFYSLRRGSFCFYFRGEENEVEVIGVVKVTLSGCRRVWVFTILRRNFRFFGRLGWADRCRV